MSIFEELHGHTKAKHMQQITLFKKTKLRPEQSGLRYDTTTCNETLQADQKLSQHTDRHLLAKGHC